MKDKYKISYYSPLGIINNIFSSQKRKKKNKTPSTPPPPPPKPENMLDYTRRPKKTKKRQKDKEAFSRNNLDSTFAGHTAIEYHSQ